MCFGSFGINHFFVELCLFQGFIQAGIKSVIAFKTDGIAQLGDGIRLQGDTVRRIVVCIHGLQQGGNTNGAIFVTFFGDGVWGYQGLTFFNLGFPKRDWAQFEGTGVTVIKEELALLISERGVVTAGVV